MTTITTHPQDTTALPNSTTQPATISGLADIAGNKAFIRTAGYQRTPSDIPVSLAQIRQYGLRRGDQVTGAVRPGKSGQQLTQLESVNGLDPEQARHRPDRKSVV